MDARQSRQLARLWRTLPGLRNHGPKGVWVFYSADMDEAVRGLWRNPSHHRGISDTAGSLG